jgi:hypothetical protein
MHGGGPPLVTMSLATCSSVVRGALKAKESEATRRPVSTRLRQLGKVPLNERGIEVAENDDEVGAEHGFLYGLQQRVVIGVRMRSVM